MRSVSILASGISALSSVLSPVAFTARSPSGEPSRHGNMGPPAAMPHIPRANDELRSCGVKDFPDNAPRCATIATIRLLAVYLFVCPSVRPCGDAGRGKCDQPECMAVIRAQQGCQSERASYPTVGTGSGSAQTATRFPDDELKVDHNQLATTTNCTTCIWITFWKWRRSSIMRSHMTITE
jgi:hypothetical protein